MQKSEQIHELAAALSKAQASMKAALKDSKNPHFKSSYADLASVWEALRLPLTSNGLSVVQGTEEEDGKVVVETMLLHSSGQWISSRLRLNPVKSDPQALGSAVTYGRRYSLAAICGAVADDDDGEAAMGRGKPVTQFQAQQQPASTKPAHVQSVVDSIQKHLGGEVVSAAEEVIGWIESASTEEELRALVPSIKGKGCSDNADVRAAYQKASHRLAVK